MLDYLDVIILQTINNKMKDQKQNDILNLNYLPRQPQLRDELKEAIQRYRRKLQKQLLKETQRDSSPNMNLMQQLQNKIEKLDMRIKLIDDCSELSILRLDHLQQIFRHYCTHIFKTGAHMTFQRLQYEKIHMTMDRFFLFVKDFQLAMMQTDNGKKEEVLEKPKIILMFKKISSTSKDLTFQEFIHCLDKLGVMYYDEKEVFYEKKEALRQEKQRRKKEYEKKKQMRLAKRKKEAEEEENQDDDEEEGEEEEQDKKQKNDKNDKNDKNEKKDKNVKNQKKEENIVEEENDDLVKDMINDKDLEDPNEQVNKITNRYAFEEQEEQVTPLKPNRLQNVNDELFLIWTNEEKIQFYYQTKIKIDSVSDYRKKLTDLNLTIFQKGQKSQSITHTKAEHKTRKNSMAEEQSRADQLKKKMEQKKLKQKASPIPKHKDDGAWAKAEQDKRRKRELKKQRQEQAKKKNKEESDALIQKKMDSQKSAKEKVVQRGTYNQNHVDWNMLGKISIDQLKLKQFNPNRYFNKDDDDRIFLDEYEGGRPRIMSGLQMRERNSMAVVEDMKKRVGEVQRKEKKEQKQLDNMSRRIGHNVPVKNRF